MMISLRTVFVTAVGLLVIQHAFAQEEVAFQCNDCTDATCATNAPVACVTGATQCKLIAGAVFGGCGDTASCADASTCCTGTLCNPLPAPATPPPTTSTTPAVKGAAMPAARLSVVAVLLSVVLFCLGFF